MILNPSKRRRKA